MKALLVLYTAEFKTLTILIDTSSFMYFGSTTGYDYPDSKLNNSISFVVADPTEETTTNTFEYIKSNFKLNPAYTKVADYVRMKLKFESYETDKRPRITIQFGNGAKGLINPPQFHMQSV